MRRSTLWFAIAAFWFADAGLDVLRHRVGMAGLTLLFAATFLVVGALYRRKELRESR
jgi:hypothetical protein